MSIANGRITVNATVPPGCRATLEIPTSDAGSVRKADAPAAEQPGVLGVQSSAVGATLRLASGRYTVSAIAPGVDSPINE